LRRASRLGLASVLRRRPEAYHAKLAAAEGGEDGAGGADAREAASGGPKTIHDIVNVKEPGLSAILHYDHHERRLAERLTDLQHHAHDLVISSMHVHLDHNHCLETLFLRGATPEVRAFAEKLSAERGVRHGKLNLVPVELEGTTHHVHSRPRT